MLIGRYTNVTSAFIEKLSAVEILENQEKPSKEKKT